MTNPAAMQVLHLLTSPVFNGLGGVVWVLLELLCLLGFVLLWLSFLIALKYLRVISGVASSSESWGRGVICGIFWGVLSDSPRDCFLSSLSIRSVLAGEVSASLVRVGGSVAP